MKQCCAACTHGTVLKPCSNLISNSNGNIGVTNSFLHRMHRKLQQCTVGQTVVLADMVQKRRNAQ